MIGRIAVLTVVVALFPAVPAAAWTTSGFTFSDFNYHGMSAPPSAGGGGGTSSAPQRDYDREAAVAWIGQGDVFAGQNRWDDADAAYSKALSLDPGNADAARKREALRDARIAKADAAVAPLKLGQIRHRLEALDDPARIARIQSMIAHLGTATAAASPEPAELQGMLTVVAGIRVAPNGLIGSDTLRRAQEIVARAAEAAARPAASAAPVDVEQLRRAQSVIAMALAQPGTTVTGAGGTAVPAPQAGQEAERAQATIGRLIGRAEAAEGAGDTPAGRGVDGGPGRSLGLLQTMFGRINPEAGSSREAGLCFDSRCAAASSAQPPTVNIPQVVAAYDADPTVPPRLLAGPDGPAIRQAEARRDTERAAAQAAVQQHQQLAQGVVEPLPRERDEAMKREAGKAVNHAVAALEASAEIDRKIDAAFHPDAD